MVGALTGGLPPATLLVADRAYDARAVIDLIRSRGGQARIPTQGDRKVQRSVDPAIYRQRNEIERFFCKLKHLNRVAIRFDKLARYFLAAVLLASTRLWLIACEATTWQALLALGCKIGKLEGGAARRKPALSSGAAAACGIGAEAIKAQLVAVAASDW